MTARTELVRAWLRKAESDLRSVDALVEAEAFDTACFHAQQAVEKSLKAYLIYMGAEFPFSHNLARLVRSCTGQDASFEEILPLVEPLTPFAVELRYDFDFWPSLEDAGAARDAAQAVCEFVRRRLPEDLNS